MFRIKRLLPLVFLSLSCGKVSVIDPKAKPASNPVTGGKPAIGVVGSKPAEEPAMTPMDPKDKALVATGIFPPDGDMLSINYKNSTDIAIVINLDNQAFCAKTSDQADCKQGDNNAWNKDLGQFFIYTEKDGKWVRKDGPRGRKQKLLPGQVWRIVPPVDERNKPFWCFDQPVGGGKWRRNCPGVGSWVTVDGVNMPAIEKVTRFEYNINEPGDPRAAHEIWFNQSAVDGSNINATTEYTGHCPDNKRVCKLDLKSCPYMGKADGALTCPSPKFWPDLDKCGTNGFGKEWNLSPRDLAGCGYPDAHHPLRTKAECHKWWATNSCAQSWLKYLQEGGRCQTYGWAYDEMRWDPSQGDKFDHNGNPKHNEVVRPLINCPIKSNASLNIDITDILH